MNIQTINKITHYNLNLDYDLNTLSLSNQTNCLINNIIRDFLIKYKNDFNSKIFIYTINDDIISLIGYKILEVIKCYQPINLRIYGKHQKIKSYIKDKKLFCSKRFIKKNLNNIILISNFNPIYEVANVKIKSNTFVKPDFYLINKFTPNELLQARVFYHIGFIKNDIINNKTLLNDFTDNFNDLNNFNNIPKTSYLNIPPIMCVYFNKNNEDNLKLMQEIEQSDKMVFYYYTKDCDILQDTQFNLLLKHTSNRPNKHFLNINNYTMPKEISQEYNIPIEYLGDFPKIIKNKIEEGIYL